MLKTLKSKRELILYTMEQIKSITIVNNNNHAVHLKITWPEGDEAYVLQPAMQVRPRLEDITEDTEIQIEAGKERLAVVYRSSVQDRKLVLMPNDIMEWQ
ncbi:MAG: hypothetical protein JWP12_1029 [Bacteroidetes bacterium]|nr:hypothetical protein [Bacteroidota bacterium]